MKSGKNIGTGEFSGIKKSKKEKAQGKKSKSLLNAPEGHLNLVVMSSLRNKVQLIGNVGVEPGTINLDNGKKLSRLSLATHEIFHHEGEKKEQTHWHNIVAWGKRAELIEKYVSKGQEIAVEGKLISRSYEDKEGQTRYLTEVVVSEILLLGKSNTQNS